MNKWIKHKKGDDKSHLLFLWSWRELNPRPNEEIIRFLHAYPCLQFSSDGKTKATNQSAYLLISHLRREAGTNQFRFISTSGSNSLRTTAFGRCLVLAPCAKIKLIYYYSIKQQEQNCYCQL